jgi:hypothetical protein
MNYREFEIEAFELGRGQWHARFRRRDRAPTVLDGVEFEFLNIGFAWSSDDAAVADAQHFIDRMQSRFQVGTPERLASQLGERERQL